MLLLTTNESKLVHLPAGGLKPVISIVFLKWKGPVIPPVDWTVGPVREAPLFSTRAGISSILEEMKMRETLSPGGDSLPILGLFVPWISLYCQVLCSDTARLHFLPSFSVLCQLLIQFSDRKVSSASIELEALSSTGIALTQLHSSLN